MTGVSCAMAGGLRFNGSATVTVGYYNNSGGAFENYGYTSGLAGSVTPSTWSTTGRTFTQLTWTSDYSGSGVDFVAFVVQGAFPNSGWTTLSIGGIDFTRSSASYSLDAVTTSWFWFTSSNPYGYTVGATKALVWS